MKTFSKTPGAERARQIGCPACAGSAHRELWKLDGCLFVRCRRCGLVYQNPQPVHDDLVQRYDGEYFRYELENESTFLRLMRLSLADVRFERETSMLPRSERRFLDIGCATGALIGSLGSEGWTVQGVEVCRPAAEYGRLHRGVPIHVGTLQDATFHDGAFTVVHCSHLIEHLTEPIAFLSEVARVLAAGGLFLVTTPNIDGLQARLFGAKWRSAIADHMVLYSRRTLSRLLRSTGFSVEAIRTWGGLGKGTAPDAMKRVLDRSAKAFGFGDVMIVRARKSEGRWARSRRPVRDRG